MSVMGQNEDPQGSVTGRSVRSVGLSRFPLTGHCRRGSNFVIFPAPKFGTGHSRVTISFRQCPSAAQPNRMVGARRWVEPISHNRSLPSRVQFQHFPGIKTRNRSFEGDDQFSAVSVGSAAFADGHDRHLYGSPNKKSSSVQQPIRFRRFD